MTEKATQPRIHPQLIQLRDSLTQSQISGLMGNILGAFPDDPETWERIAERHGREIKRHCDAISVRIICDLATADQLPVEEELKPEFSGYLTGRAGR